MPALAFWAAGAGAQDEWRDNLPYLIYTPRYFGPNAFPLPELREGRLRGRAEAEVRGEYQACKGDRTKDVYARVYLPVAGGKAAVEAYMVMYEYYNMTAEVVAERHAWAQSWPSGAHGDVVVSALYQVVESAEWADVTAEAALKTASGNRLVDARYTDAAAYWFDLSAGRTVYSSPGGGSWLRLMAMAGFYCWMTNDLVHRQNDALAWGAGLSGRAGAVGFEASLRGFYGYENTGDRPVQLGLRMDYSRGLNALSLRYRRGLKDALYDSFSAAYIRYF